MKKIIFTTVLFFSFTYLIGQWTWQNPLPQGNGLTCIDFFDSNIGFAAGYLGTMLKTTNGGITWEYVQRPTPKSIYSIAVIDEYTCYIVGESGMSFKTTDGGINWENLTTGTDMDLNAMHFPDNNTGYAVGDS